MFEGSKNVAEGEFDTLLEAAGANNNGSTNGDRTNYIIDVPANALELALFLESDRMAYLLDTMTPARVDGQRDVVKNERRQSYENRPYGMASLELDEMLWPTDHPYHWPTIGYMEDLTAASHDDVVQFFATYYAPNNASLVVAGDIDLDAAQAARREVVRRDSAGGRGAADRAAARAADGGPAANAARPRAPAAVVSLLADAAAVRAGRCGARSAVGRAGERQELSVVQAPRLRHANGAGRRGLSRERCARRRVPYRGDGEARAHRGRAQAGDRRGNRARATGRRRRRARSNARATRSRRRSTAAWSASAASAARPIS